MDIYFFTFFKLGNDIAVKAKKLIQHVLVQIMESFACIFFQNYVFRQETQVFSSKFLLYGIVN